LLTEEFLTTVFGNSSGYLFLSTKYAPSDKEITNHKAFKYPENLKQAIAYASVREDEDLYFSPMLYKVPQRRAMSASVTPVLYADTDTFPVDQYRVAPSINIETSPGRHASLWLLDSPDYDKEDVQAVSRAIALTHAKTEDGKQAGVDPGGWDLSQLLRVPNSLNLKYLVQGKYDGYTEPYEVQVDESISPLTIYSLDEIRAAYDPDQNPDLPSRSSMDMPDEEDLPAPADVLRRITASRALSDLYGKVPGQTQDWSDMLYRFIGDMLRAGFTPEEAFVGAWYAECNKYKRDNRPMSDLWDYDMKKAIADPNNRPRTTVESTAWEEYKHPKDEGISTAIEVALLSPDQQTTPTFVDGYVKWAANRTDAPAAYHIAGAMTVMSCVLGEFGIGYPQFGELRLGLNFVIMGETTDTRKTTSRNLMKTMLRAVQEEEYEYILTSDATGEALLDTLSERENQSSLYDRDEAQQLIDDIKGGKGYLKGFFETLNELYDGWAHGRLRSSKRTSDTKVNFIQYLMGIRSQIQENLELHDFASGWGPRNIWVRGESPQRTRENSRLRQGKIDDAKEADATLAALALALRDMREFWEGESTRENPHKMMFEDDAWVLMTDLEWDLKDYFDQHPRYEVLKPCIERLTINAMKVAILFAMSDKRKTVNIQDVINVRAYAAKWMEDLLIVVEGVNESIYLRDVRALEKYIADHDGLVTYGQALKWGLERGLDRRQFSELVDTLAEQDTITLVDDASGKKSLSLL
jgi:hypothetical protein